MYEEALGRLNDAEILSKSINRETDSNYLLELLAFELLSNCCSRRKMQKPGSESFKS